MANYAMYTGASCQKCSLIGVDDAHTAVFGRKGLARVGELADTFVAGEQEKRLNAVLGEEITHGVGPLLAQLPVVFGSSLGTGVAMHHKAVSDPFTRLQRLRQIGQRLLAL